MSIKRTQKLSIRLTPLEYKHFLAVQRNSGLKQADFLMRAIDSIPLPNTDAIEVCKDTEKKIDMLLEQLKSLESTLKNPRN